MPAIDRKEFPFYRPCSTLRIVSTALLTLAKYLGPSFREHRMSSLAFLHQYPTGFARGIFQDFIVFFRLHRPTVGADFLVWHSALFGIECFPFTMVRVRHIIKLPPNVIAFRTNEWLNPPIYGMNPPSRPDLESNLIRWTSAVSSCEETLKRMRKTSVALRVRLMKRGASL